MSGSDLVVIRRFPDRIEADLARSALEAAGIESLVRADDMGGTRPHMWVSEGVDLVVRAENLAAAREVLDTSAEPCKDAPRGR